MVKRVGVIGGGQLAWMMADAAKKLEIDLLVQTPSPQDPAVSIAHKTVFAPVADAIATAKLAHDADVITFENEFVDLEALSKLAHQGTCFRPSTDSLLPLLDKYDQRCFLRDRHLPTPTFSTLEDFTLTSFPVVLKTRRHGYDGQGTFVIKDKVTWDATVQKLKGIPLLVEEFIPFERELAVMAARSTTGEVVVYPVVETQQENQVCQRVIAPADISESVAREVEAIATKLLESLQVVGIFGIELFLDRSDRVLVNEIAPRTHNSGHYTLDACQTSQFEQQLRAICGLPLGNPNLNCMGAVMVNLLGYESAKSNYLEKRQRIAEIPNAFVHWYSKSESRPGRKLGHVTVRLEVLSSNVRTRALEVAQAIEDIWYRS
jgi:5-(carboxyamino)imidazole ribonucleotide synthase